MILISRQAKIVNDMAKVQQKSEKITAFGGIFFVLDKFDHRAARGGRRSPSRVSPLNVAVVAVVAVKK